MWEITDIWSNKDYPLIIDYHIELTCTKCGTKLGLRYAVGKTIKPCECETKC